MSKGTGLRYNTGKARLGLLPAFATKMWARVMTKGAAKYTVKNEDGSIKMDGANNWRGGMNWTDVMDSMERHINAWKQGEDIDPETSEYHLAHVMCNASFLLEYIKIFPQGDNRPNHSLVNMRIGLDLDDVLADWVPTFCAKLNIPIPQSWYFGFTEHKEKISDYDAFMLNLPVKTPPSEIPFEPVCYITNRGSVPEWVAEAWLDRNGYPKVPVIQTAYKVEVAKEHKLDIFVDDKFETFQEMHKAGIMCYLFDAPHNRRYSVGHWRIYSLKEILSGERAGLDK